MIKNLICLGILATPAALMAQSAVGHARATVVAPLALAETRQMNFGAFIAPGERASQIRLLADGTRGLGPGILAGPAAGNPPASGAFQATGQANAAFRVQPIADFDLTRAEGAETMRVSITAVQAKVTLRALPSPWAPMAAARSCWSPPWPWARTRPPGSMRASTA